MPLAPNKQLKQQTMEIEEFAVVQGMETREQRDAITPGFYSWLMNMQPIGKRTLRILDGKASTLYTAPGGDSILWYYTAIIGTTYYLIVFLTSGKADQVQISNGTVTHISTVANTFWNGTGEYPHAVSWGNKGILIVSTVSANAYWAWDGTTLYAASAAAPTWLYPSGSTKTTMPTGVSGTAVEIYSSMVWIINGLTIQASAPSVGTDFATSDGGVNLTVQDAYVQDGYSGLKALDGFLYLYAHGAVDVISDVQTSGSPATTTFLRVPISTSIGSPWRDSIVASPTSLISANTTGVYEVAGGNIRKVSDSLDGIFETATFPVAATDPSGFHPTSVMVTLNEVACYALTITVTDPDTNTAINGLALWDGKRWFLATQETQPVVVQRQDSDSVFSCWGSDRTTIYKMFNVASSTLSKKGKSWMTLGKLPINMYKSLERVYAQFANAPAGAPFTSFNIDTETSTFPTTALGTPGILTFINNSGATIQFQNNSSQDINFTGIYPLIAGGNAGGIICLLFGLTFSTTTATLDIVGLAIGYTAYFRWE